MEFFTILICVVCINLPSAVFSGGHKDKKGEQSAVQRGQHKVVSFFTDKYNELMQRNKEKTSSSGQSSPGHSSPSHGHSSSGPSSSVLHESQQCGQFPLSKMELFYCKTTEEWAVHDVIHLWRAKEPNDRSVPNIFTGYLGFTDEKLVPSKCVTVKVTNTDVAKEKEIFENNVQIMEHIHKHFEEKADERQQHIINVLHFGEVRHLEGTEHLTIMELTHPLKPIDFSNQKQFEQEIGEFARALQPLHEIGIINVNVNRANFVYANWADGLETVKLANFDHSFILPLGESSMPFPASWIEKNSELQDARLTKKIDMQDLGKLVFESYIVQPKFHIGEKIRKNVLELFEMIHHASSNDEDFRISANWLLDKSNENGKANTLKYLLEIRRDYPRIFWLIQDLLQSASNMAMKVDGVLKFLAGSCKPTLFTQIFPGLSDADLTNILKENTSLSEIMDKGTRGYEEEVKKMEHLQSCPQA